jgi:hypothetical protein
LGVELTEASVTNVDDVIRLLIVEKELAGSSNWEARRRAFKRHHNLDLKKCAQYHYLEGAIEARNAIAHGLGRLTTRQRLAPETSRHLAAANVAVVNNRVELKLDHLIECTRCCAEFIVALDNMLP